MMKTRHSRQIATHDFLRSWLRALLAVSLALGLISTAQAQQRGEGRAKISRELADELDGLTARRSLSALSRRRTFIVQTGSAINQQHLAKLVSYGARLRKVYGAVNLMAVEMPLGRAADLAEDPAFT